MTYQLVLSFYLILSLNACNSLFYYPDRVTYLTPDKKGFSYQEAVAKTPDGEALSYWTLGPKGEKFGTILHFHGNAQNISAHFLFVAWFTNFGYEVISFDYRGYGKSSGTPHRQGLFTDGQVMLNLLETREVPYFVIGQSLGGAVAIPAIANAKPAHLKGLILDSTFASYRGIARLKLALHPITWLLQWPLSFLVTDELSPIDSVNGLNVPVIQYHSRQDHVVPFEQGEKLFSGFSGKQKFVALERIGHTTAFVPPFSKHHRDLLLWLCKLNQKSRSCIEFVEAKLSEPD